MIKIQEYGKRVETQGQGKYALKKKEKRHCLETDYEYSFICFLNHA